MFASRRADVTKNLTQGDQIVTRLLRRAQIWIANDFHEWHAGTIQIDEADLVAQFIDRMYQASGVLFDMNPGDTGSDHFAFGLERSDGR